MTANLYEIGKPHLLRKTKARIPPSSCEGTMEPLVSRTTERGVRKILRVFLGNPWDDYVPIRHIGHNIIARLKDLYFKLVNIRQCHRENVLKQACIVSSFKHANIATVYAVYCAGEKAFLVTEHLDVCFTQLELQKYAIEEWEVATILLEVIVVPLSGASKVYFTLVGAQRRYLP